MTQTSDYKFQLNTSHFGKSLLWIGDRCSSKKHKCAVVYEPCNKEVRLALMTVRSPSEQQSPMFVKQPFGLTVSWEAGLP